MSTEILATAEAVIKQYRGHRRISDVKGLKAAFLAFVGREIRSVTCGTCIDTEMAVLIRKVAEHVAANAAAPPVTQEVSQEVKLPKAKRVKNQ